MPPCFSPPQLYFLPPPLQHLRPLLSPSQLVFPNTKGNEIDHLSRRVKDLAAKHKLQLPVATDSRHVAGTAASRSCNEQEKESLASLMSHSRVNLHLSPRGADWKAFSAHYIIPPLASSIYCINISIHSPCNVLSSDPGLTIPEFVFILYYSQPAAQFSKNICLANLH